MRLGVVIMMEVSIKQAEPMNVAYLSMHGPYSQMPQALGVLYRFAGEQGLAPTGAPRAVYFTPPDVEAPGPDWEVWAPVASAVSDVAPDANGLGTRRVPGKLVASTMHKGPYEDLESTYSSLCEWIADHGYEIVGAPEEIYLSDPAEVPPEAYLTEIQFPVKKT